MTGFLAWLNNDHNIKLLDYDFLQDNSQNSSFNVLYYSSLSTCKQTPGIYIYQ